MRHMIARPLPAANPLRRMLQSLRDFLRLETASSVLLLGALFVASLWANSPLAHLYEAAFNSPVRLPFGASVLRLTLQSVINDGLMTVFFFVVGMEIKRELRVGELRHASRAALPAVGALGGMVVPALVYLAFTAGSPAQQGWAIPMATDVAFSLGCLTILKRKLVPALIVFVTALAIVDDIGGIAVIAVFYGGALHLSWLIAALALLLLLAFFDRRPVSSLFAFLCVGALLWFVLARAGIHPTIAGVALGLAIPGPTSKRDRARPSPVETFLPRLHPWAAYAVMPLFALANAGVTVAHVQLSHLLGPVSVGCAAGLFLGKQLGILSFTWTATKLGLAPIPGNASPRMLHAVSTVAGIGFTVSLFIAGIAFEHQPALLAQARLGILAGSGASALAGTALLRLAR